MGRTIHFDIRKTKGPFTKSDKRKLIDISAKYNSGEYENFWTCENFFVGAYYYPNWKYFERIGSLNSAWDIINYEMDRLKKENYMHTLDAIITLEGKGLIICQDYKEKKNEVYGFVKTRNNERNAQMVIEILVEISKSIKDTCIEVRDEGGVLCGKTCFITNGVIEASLDDIDEESEPIDSIYLLYKKEKRPIPENIIIETILRGQKDKVKKRHLRSKWKKFMYEHVA